MMCLLQPTVCGRYAEQRIQATKAGKMFLNLLKVHGMAYKAIKAIGPELQVGLVHQFIEMLPERNWHFHTAPIAARITQLFSKQIVLDWFRTGSFQWRCGFCASAIEYQSPELPRLDFLGMNYYSRWC
ncbi:MAG: hypothetical protein HC767_05220 [Akkermansiaceae bacterium]|nr:hypothetical protein [Akkermansiaceae bacterium]